MDKTFLGAIDTAQLKDVFTQSQSPPYPKKLVAELSEKLCFAVLNQSHSFNFVSDNQIFFG